MAINHIILGAGRVGVFEHSNHIVVDVDTERIVFEGLVSPIRRTCCVVLFRRQLELADDR